MEKESMADDIERHRLQFEARLWPSCLNVFVGRICGVCHAEAAASYDVCKAALVDWQLLGWARETFSDVGLLRLTMALYCVKSRLHKDRTHAAVDIIDRSEQH
jgi:hypothetical protein